MRQLVIIAVVLFIVGCTTYQVTPVTNSTATSGGPVDVLYSNPTRPFEVIGMVSAKKYKPGWTDPTVSDALPELRAAGAQVNADAVIVRSSRSNNDRTVLIEAEAIRYTGQALAPTASPGITAMMENSQVGGQPAAPSPAPRGDRAEKDCAAIQIATIRADCERDIREITNELDCTADGAVFRLTRSVDRITDVASCTVMLSPGHQKAGKGGPLAMVIGGRLSFGVMGDDFPGEQTAIRVDGNAAYVFDEVLSGDSAKRLLGELRRGTNVTTRFNEWPYHVNRDNTFKVCNFATLVDECLGSR